MIDHTDRDVYALIAERQQAALGATSDITVGQEDGHIDGGDRMYSHNPRPITSDLPAVFRPKPENKAPEAKQAPGDTDYGAQTPSQSEASTEITQHIFTEAQRPHVKMFGLRDSIRFAMKHARDLQTAKEALYLAALDLTLERHLWTPQFVATFTNTYDDYEEEDASFDQTFSTLSEVAVSQRLPYGGDITARVISSFVRDLTDHLAAGEDARIEVDGTIRLLRGAGRAAVTHESLYAAERGLIYATRTYERFRRSFIVDVAGRYLELQQSKASIANTFKAYENRKIDWEKTNFIQKMGRSKDVFEAPRAKSSLRQSQAALVSAKERYESALDRFKIFLGMNVGELLNVIDQDLDQDSQSLDDLLGDIDIETAQGTALKYRLDLLNQEDFVDDTRRGVKIARNSILPDLNLTGSLTSNSDPDHLSSSSFATERTSWRAGVFLQIDDRKRERNAHRRSLINLRHEQRNYDEAKDNVRAQVRRAMRRIEQQNDLRLIQQLNVEENELRLEAARAQYDLGKSTNQDVVDAENDLLDARNQLAAAVADYRIAVLELRLSTGTIRVTNDGRWQEAPTPPARQGGP